MSNTSHEFISKIVIEEAGKCFLTIKYQFINTEETIELGLEKCFTCFTKGEERHFSLRKQHMQREYSLTEQIFMIAYFLLCSRHSSRYSRIKQRVK